MTTQIVSVDATTSKLQVGGVDAFQFKPNGVMESIASVNSGYLYGNRVINGAQEIDQVNSGAAVTLTNTGGYTHATDMFGAAVSQASKLSFQQVADAPAGLKNSIKFTVVAAYTPVAADSYVAVTFIEGKDVIDFQLGAAGAQVFTLSYWVKASVAGNYPVSLRNAAANRSYVGTVAVTTAWAPVKLTVQGDLAGTWLTDAGIGLGIVWDLGSGSNYNTTAGAWQAGLFTRVAGAVSFVSQTAGSTLNITGVDCRLGSTAPAVFERRANELQLAQRYAYVITTSAAQVPLVNASVYFSTNAYGVLPFPVVMRSSPTASFVNAANWNLTYSGTVTAVTLTQGTATPQCSELIGTGTGMTVGAAGWYRTNGASTNQIIFSARLF